MCGGRLAVLSGGRWGCGSGAGQRAASSFRASLGTSFGAQVLARAAQSLSAGRGAGGASGGRVGEGSVRGLAAPVRSGGGARRGEESGGTLGAPSGAGRGPGALVRGEGRGRKRGAPVRAWGGARGPARPGPTGPDPEALLGRGGAHLSPAGRPGTRLSFVQFVLAPIRRPLWTSSLLTRVPVIADCITVNHRGPQMCCWGPPLCLLYPSLEFAAWTGGPCAENNKCLKYLY